MGSETDILSFIKNNREGFSKRQRMVADYILRNYDRAAYMTAAALSNAVGVSESTVVRFAAELGFDGYQRLQRRLQEVARTQLNSIQRMDIASRRIDSNDILSNVLKSDIDKIEKTLAEIDQAQFDGAVEALLHAENIYITGVRSAAALASFTGFYFNRLFENVRLINTTGADDIFEQILRAGSGDAVLGMSFPRYSRNTLKALEYAKHQGATVIGITDSVNSPIVKQSHYCLIARSDMDSFVDSLVAPFSVVNALIVALGMKKRDEVRDIFEKLETIWDEYGVYDKE
ncbi:MAG TPA: MurR/RpiR family transcriptional regulator [Candidatus Avimonoglobus intestinipullorum]|uniref:MurR/RpiR family transcriptional regulator n=1 Tax=Candidatus Avimonoglobus intestinipullorum TaxID=2840699 RepID=A0A9D1S6A1_9FIRM|nr:MurR/RpiR family transcriptional regulator [Candidatus Avimonoglobus intestinipullorum]